MKTINDTLRSALDVQNACNLSGVLISFAKVIQILRENGITDTAAINSHPSVILYADKVSSLVNGDFSHAYDIASKIEE